MPSYFSGFTAGKAPTVRLPEQLFTELLPQIDDLRELQITLLVLRRLAQLRSTAAPWITRAELCSDPVVQATFGAAGEAALDEALTRAVTRGTLLTVQWERGDGVVEQRYLANSPRGRAAVAALEQGRSLPRAEIAERPNIFTLYEQNIGPLTPLLSDELKEAEQTYPPEWVEEAFREAVRLNRRHWKYIRAILERWRTEGRTEKDEIRRGDRQTAHRRYVTDEYADLIQH